MNYMIGSQTARSRSFKMLGDIHNLPMAMARIINKPLCNLDPNNNGGRQGCCTRGYQDSNAGPGAGWLVWLPGC